jgi:hypothetical protein
MQLDLSAGFTGSLYYVLYNTIPTFDIITTSVGTKFYFNADSPANYVLDASNNVIRWKNRISGGIDASANTINTSNNYPKIELSVPGNIGKPFMRLHTNNNIYVGFDFSGGSIRAGESNQQTFFMFGYIYDKTAGGGGYGMFYSKPGSFLDTGTLHIGWDDGTVTPLGKLSVINGYNATTSRTFSTNSILGFVGGATTVRPGYYMMSITVDCSYTNGTTNVINMQAYSTYNTVDDGSVNRNTIKRNEILDLHKWNIGYWDQAGRSLNSAIGETMYFNRILSKNERYILEGTIAWKYGQASILPSSHQYKTFPPFDPLIFYVTVSNMAYVINGLANGPINLVRGNTYAFYVIAPGHPFYIQTSSGAYNSGNIYNTGVTGNGTENGTITIVVSATTPQQLYYACQNHGSMNGSIVVG